MTLGFSRGAVGFIAPASSELGGCLVATWGDHGRNRLHDSEWPGPSKEAVGGGQQTSAREPEDVAAMPVLLSTS